jgi:hypothetical protein
MKAFHHRASVFLSLLLAASTSAETLPHLFESDGTGPPNKLYWQTEPGIRYDLWKSDNLSSWQRVTGYPAVAEGLAMEHAFTPSPGGKGFFKMIPIDEQPPVVVAQFPAVDGFAVGRFADLSIELWDATGINPASIRLTVGGTGPLAPGAPGLTISGNTVTYDSGDAALGAWGATVTATLVAADTLGHSLTHTWSFRLEPEPQTAANVFVFGSPTAQRAGQRVTGPAAALAARFPAPAGPQKAGDPPAWSIHEVLSDRIVIAYQAGGAPAFTAGQLVCNLAPAKESEIFYRRVVSTSDDVVNLKLTVMTTDAALTDFATSGSAAVTENSVVYELDENGTLTRAVAVTGTLTFPPIGYDLSGSRFKLRSDGYEVTVKGLTYSSGSAPTWLDVTATEYSWWFTPRIRAGLELDLFGLKSFEAIASGQVSSSSVLDAEVVLLGVSVERILYDLPEVKEPKTVVYVGNIGIIPVYATLGFDFSVKSTAEAKALLDFNLTYRQEASASFGLAYTRGEPLDWIHSFQATSPDLRGDMALTGEFSYELKLDPRVEFLVYGLAGMKAALEPSAKIIATASTGGGLNGKAEGAAGPAFDALNIEKELSYNIWEGEWPFIPQTLAFNTHPQSRTVAPGDDVSFTCTVDSPSAPSFQWYQNGRLLPGFTSRSLFLPNVNSGHAGSYFVRAKAGGQTVDSNTATLTVQAVTPATLDNDSDGIPNIHETNTGTWVSATNRGTNPNKWDTDGDGLSDGVETNTRIYVSRRNTGTNPLAPDTDGDGVNDKREIDLGTNPNLTWVYRHYADAVGEVVAGNFPFLDISSVDVSVDDWRKNIRFSINLSGYPVPASWGKYCIGISSRPGGDLTGSGWLRPIRLTGGMTDWIGSWVDSGGFAGVWKYNNGIWGDQSHSFSANSQAAIVVLQDSVIVTVPLADLGLSSGQTFVFDVYTTGSGANDSAVDALSLVGTSIIGWSDPFITTAPLSFTVPE